MTNTPKLETHYGVKVWTNKQMDEARKTECLCLNCANIRKCPIAKSLYSLCKKENLATCITRCPMWKESENT